MKLLYFVLFFSLIQGALAQEKYPQSFMQRDIDGNGRLTLVESGLEPKQFESLDNSKNGELSLGEFKEHWTEIALPPDIEGVAYGSESKRQTLDFFLPPEPTGKVPLVLWIHGGSWKEGSRAGCPFQTLTQYGFAVASLDYRYVSESRFPAQLEDCRLAIRWLKQEAEKRGFEIGEITSVGLSAGGHLSLLLASSNGVDRAISFAAPVDLTNKLAQEYHRDTLEALVGAPLEENQEKLRGASPALQTPVAPKQYLLVHGLEDRTVPYSEALLMAEVVAKAQGSVQVVLVPDGSHTLVGGPKLWQQILLAIGAKA